MHRRRAAVAAAVLGTVAGLAGCASAGVGISIPIGRIGGVGVSVGSDGRIGGSVGVGGAGGSVSVGGTGQLPRSADPPAPAASAP